VDDYFWNDVETPVGDVANVENICKANDDDDWAPEEVSDSGVGNDIMSAASNQGDQMGLSKIAQNLAQPLFCNKKLQVF
jgi:hypothetical protein